MTLIVQNGTLITKNGRIATDLGCCCSPSFDCCSPDGPVSPPLEISVSFAWSNLSLSFGAVTPQAECFLNNLVGTYVLQAVNYNQVSYRVTYQGTGSNGLAIAYVWACAAFYSISTTYKSNQCGYFFQCFNTQLYNLVGQAPRHEGLCAAKEEGFSTAYTLTNRQGMPLIHTDKCVPIQPGQIQMDFDVVWTMTPL